MFSGQLTTPDTFSYHTGCHCMLAGESRISSNMTISAFYRTQQLQFNVPRTYLCLIIRNEIGLHLYLLPLANIGLFKWNHNHLPVTSFSLFNNRVIYLDFYLMAQPVSV